MGDVVGIFPGDPLIHIEEVAVALADHVNPLLVDHVGEIQIDTISPWTNSVPLVAHGLHGTRSDISWCKIAKTRVPAFQKIVAFSCEEYRPDAGDPPAVSVPTVVHRCGAIRT